MNKKQSHAISFKEGQLSLHTDDNRHCLLLINLIKLVIDKVITGVRGRCTLIILLNSPQKSVQLKQCCRRSEISVVHLPHLPNYSYRRMVLTLIQGFSVEGQENIQEILSKQLYLCQFLVAISILRPGKAQIRFVY